LTCLTMLSLAIKTVHRFENWDIFISERTLNKNLYFVSSSHSSGNQLSYVSDLVGSSEIESL